MTQLRRSGFQRRCGYCHFFSIEGFPRFHTTLQLRLEV
jgi:hypothetical protein